MKPFTVSMKCVNGLKIVRRWMGTESMNQSFIEVSSSVLEYNIFNIGVILFHKPRSAHATARSESGNRCAFKWNIYFFAQLNHHQFI